MESLYNVLLQFKKIYIQREFMKKGKLFDFFSYFQSFKH